MKLGIDEELKAPYMFKDIFARSAQGWIQGGVKIGYGGLLKNFFRADGYSNKPNT